ncbi:IS5 family transposase [Azospirillum oleiclasticum]|uniref:IS5 family transposase n=1 Tax=Azospirillum oleiclasticum TaxID=2735135 RepID=UPI003CCD823A
MPECRLTVWFSDEAVERWRAETRSTPGGQRTYSDLAILTALMLRAVYRLALRQTEGLLASLAQLLGLDLAVPDHSTLSRRAKTVTVPAAPATANEPVCLLVDSTGVKLCGPGDWLVAKHGTRRRRAWRKLHIGLDTATGRILAATLTDHDVDDVSQVGPLLDQIAEPLDAVVADGAYDQSGVYEAVTKRHPGAGVVVPPRSTAVPRAIPRRAHRHSGIGIRRPSPQVDAARGRQHPATTCARSWKLTSAATNT